MSGAAGAIVIRDDGKNICWRKKCESCGYVEPGSHASTKPAPHSTMTQGIFHCPKCQQTSEVIIFG